MLARRNTRIFDGPSGGLGRGESSGNPQVVAVLVLVCGTETSGTIAICPVAEMLEVTTVVESESYLAGHLFCGGLWASYV
jgi:hypothetical protein